MLNVIDAGLQVTLQGAPRTGLRHLGFPASGPMDWYSMALANKLVGNFLSETCLEIPFGKFGARFEKDATIAVTGACASVFLNGLSMSLHQTLHVKKGDELCLRHAEAGARAYLSVRGGIKAKCHYGSTSTYLPAQIGGHEGRALRTGDVLEARQNSVVMRKTLTTPRELRPRLSKHYALRAVEGPELAFFGPSARAQMLEQTFQVGAQSNRMGLALKSDADLQTHDAKMASVPVFPGTIQCPPSGTLFALSCDAQTTGGYPRVLHIIDADRHLLGQLRPGDRVQFLRRSVKTARRDSRSKTALLHSWLDQA